jgi:hypothetical protein
VGALIGCGRFGGRCGRLVGGFKVVNLPHQLVEIVEEKRDVGGFKPIILHHTYCFVKEYVN